MDAGHALERLPAIARALEEGVLSLDKVVELARFATRYDEDELIAWAREAAPAAIRERADAARRASVDKLRHNRWRELRWWWEDDGARLALWGSLPADKGAIVVTALDRLADRVPELAVELPVCTGDALSTIDGKIDGGPAIPPEVVQRLACDCRLQAVLHGEGGIVGIGMTARNIPRWLRRAVEHRDGYRCTFPGCDAKRFVQVHHIVAWPHGPTEVANLMCACSFHHDLLHQHGWHATLGSAGMVRWFRPDWTPYEPRPAPAALLN